MVGGTIRARLLRSSVKVRRSPPSSQTISMTPCKQIMNWEHSRCACSPRLAPLGALTVNIRAMAKGTALPPSATTTSPSSRACRGRSIVRTTSRSNAAFAITSRSGRWRAGCARECLGKMIANSRLQIDLGAPAGKPLEQAGIADKIATFNGVQIRRFRHMPHFDAASGVAERLQSHETKCLREGVAQTGRDHIMFAVSHPLNSKRPAKCIHDIAEKSEVADVFALPIERQGRTLARPPHDRV